MSKPVVFLVPELSHDRMVKAYCSPYGLDPGKCEFVGLPVGEKLTAARLRTWFQETGIQKLDSLGCQYLLVADAASFKAIAKVTQAEPYLGYVKDTDLGPWKVLYVPNYKVMWKDPEKVGQKVSLAIQAVKAHASGAYKDPGSDIVRQAEYPVSDQEIHDALARLHAYPELTCDIEAFSLKPQTAGVGTIAFAWNQGEGIAFAVDYEPIPGAVEAPFGRRVHNQPVRDLLTRFLEEYQGTLTFHNAGYDASVLVAQLFMSDILDPVGRLNGLECILGKFEDTKLVSYLATNSCSGNDNSLKTQAQAFAGNYAVEVKDILKVPLPDLLRYNLIDCLSTWYVKGRRYPEMVRDEQLPIYETIFKPALRDIVQMQTTGLPVSMPRVLEVEAILVKEVLDARKRIQESPIVVSWVRDRTAAFVSEKNDSYKEIVLKDGTVKRKVITESDLSEKTLRELQFNPNSGPQLQALLFDFLGLPVLDRTDTGQPATGADTMKALQEKTGDASVLLLLKALFDLQSVKNIYTTFIPALKGAIQGPDGWHYLFGNFNLGGTVSGRLSSSDPNLQNIPAKGKWGKLIKSCIMAPPGKAFMGCDFDSLEDKISALTTRDPMKLKVYTQGFDGHCLRAQAYWPHKFPEVSLAPEEAICYRANVGGTYVWFHADETVEYMGQVMKGKELHALLAGQGL